MKLNSDLRFQNTLLQTGRSTFTILSRRASGDHGLLFSPFGLLGLFPLFVIGQDSFRVVIERVSTARAADVIGLAFEANGDAR